MELLLPHEAARFLRPLGLDLTPARLRALELSGELPAVRTENGTRLFRPAVLRRYAERRTKIGRRGAGR